MKPLRPYRRLLKTFSILAVIVMIGLFMLSSFSSPPGNLGVRNGKLAPLNGSPNGVSSMDRNQARRDPPISFEGSGEAAMNRIRRIVQQLPRTEIVKETADYLRAECSSRVFGFVDDLEFLLDDNAKLIHFRSASRVGYWDLGANRKRMERIKDMFANQTSNPQSENHQ